MVFPTYKYISNDMYVHGHRDGMLATKEN